MRNLVLYAPPAAGKGTICEKLEQDYGYSVISIGQVLRNNRNPETEIGKIIIKTQDEGILTPDDIVAKALALELEKYEGKPIVLEGYPRNIKQAKALDNILKDYGVIVLQITREEGKKRALGRVTCSNCHKIYNIYDEVLSPKKEGVCDNCGAKLDIRSDDNEESFNKRFDVFEENAPVIIDYYKEKGILHLVDGNKSQEECYHEVKEIIDGSKND